ncbi:hypothetical protein BS78_07G222500 [Paspalum vaginatum]|nr:hypothetical protein BS78_07G222500 [Paspalum vaginatum]
MASHLRSTSLPSSPRSNIAEVEQQVRSLKGTMASSSATIDTMCGGLSKLGSLYSGIEEMMCTPSNQANLCQTLQRKAVEGELGRSLILLDLCSTMQESFIELKMIITNKVHKQFKVCKKTTSDKKDCRVGKLLAEARLITASVLEYTSCLLTKQIEMPKRSLISITFQKRKVLCEEEQPHALKCSIRDLESRAELLFGKLIHCRVSLLNTLSS